MTKQELLQQFDKDILSINERKNENEIQKFLDANTELIPIPFRLNHEVHFNFIFSKLKISDSLTSDYAYLTKSSAKWVMVLMELEASNKRIFTNSSKNITFSAEFNNAYDQILSWKAYLHDNKEEFKKRFDLLMGHMYKNPLSFKYALVIGRSAEINTQEKIQMFAQKETDEIQILTYDSLIRIFNLNNSRTRNLVSKVKNGYELRNFSAYTSAFAYLKSGNLFFDDTVESKLIAEGFDIPSWRKGTLLTLNGTKPLKTFGKVKTNEKYMTDEIED